MASPYIRTLVGSFNDVYIDPSPTVGPPPRPTQIYPAGGLTPQGTWVPLAINPDGTLPSEGGTGANGHFDDAAETTTPGALQTLISATVPDGITRSLYQAIVVTRVTGDFQVIAGGEIIGSGRTGPAGTGPMVWNPGRPLAPGTAYEIIFQSRSGSPPQDVEAYVQAVDVIV